jgi:hypothetical protein
MSRFMRATLEIRYTPQTASRHQQTGCCQEYMKYIIALLIVILIAAGLVLQGNDEKASDAPVTGLPWQIDILPNGNTRVFGIELGLTTLETAIAQLGNDMELAIIAAPGETGTLEAYYSHYSAGPITGKLILIMDVPAEMLTEMRVRAFQEGGTRRHHLHPDDLPVARRAPVRVITFMPSFNLDEAIAQERFGAPVEIIQVNKQQKHLLYPGKGLDLILNADGKELLQYLQPQAFTQHRAALQPQSTGEE